MLDVAEEGEQFVPALGQRFFGTWFVSWSEPVAVSAGSAAIALLMSNCVSHRARFAAPCCRNAAIMAQTRSYLWVSRPHRLPHSWDLSSSWSSGPRMCAPRGVVHLRCGICTLSGVFACVPQAFLYPLSYPLVESRLFHGRGCLRRHSRVSVER